MASAASSQVIHATARILGPTMSASKALAAPLPSGNLPRSFTPRRRRLHHRSLRTASRTTDAAPAVSLLSIGLVGGVSLLLALIACSFIVTGLAVWVANGAAEWLAAAVPALFAGLLFAFAVRMARLLSVPRH